jgi:hypothetical protein
VSRYLCPWCEGSYPVADPHVCPTPKGRGLEAADAPDLPDKVLGDEKNSPTQNGNKCARNGNIPPLASDRDFLRAALERATKERDRYHAALLAVAVEAAAALGRRVPNDRETLGAYALACVGELAGLVGRRELDEPQKRQGGREG